MPTYVYEILDKNGQPTGETFEVFQSIKEDAYKFMPGTKNACRRAIIVPRIKHNGPAWEWCESTRKWVNEMKPKYLNDGKRKIKFPKGGV